MKKTSRTIIGVLAAGAALYALSQMKGDSSLTKKKTVMATSANPAFTFPKGSKLTDDQSREIIFAILAQMDPPLDYQKMASGGERKLSEQEFNQLLSKFQAAINYYPDSADLVKIKDDFVAYKDNFVGGAHAGYHAGYHMKGAHAGYHANAGYHMGQIDGISGVY